jgi:hypothetical protein
MIPFFELLYKKTKPNLLPYDAPKWGRWETVTTRCLVAPRRIRIQTMGFTLCPLSFITSMKKPQSFVRENECAKSRAFEQPTIVKYLNTQKMTNKSKHNS